MRVLGVDQKDCRDQDSANRMSIEGGNRLYWYETRCRASEITAEANRSWKMRLACEGEGRSFAPIPGFRSARIAG